MTEGTDGRRLVKIARGRVSISPPPGCPGFGLYFGKPGRSPASPAGARVARRRPGIVETTPCESVLVRELRVFEGDRIAAAAVLPLARDWPCWPSALARQV